MGRVLTDEEMKSAWRQRFKAERKKHYPTQEAFADAMVQEGFTTNPSTVGRWEKIGDNYGKERPSFPNFPTIQAIAKLLNVQIGYLIGESDAVDFDTQKASSYLGLSIEATESLKELASKPGANSSRFDEKYDVPNTSYSDTLNRVLTSESFHRYIAHLNELDCKINDFERTHTLEARKEKEEFEENLHCKREHISPETNPELFDEDGHAIDDEGMRLYDPLDPERIGSEILGVRDKIRIAKCLLIDDQLATVREIWPQTSSLDMGKADLGDVIAIASENDCTIVTKKGKSS